MAFTDKFEAGVIENVLFEFDADGVDAIWIQVLKLSDETCRVPEQDVFDVLVVMVLVSISSEKVTAMIELMEVEVAPSAGEVEETVGAIESNTIALFAPSEPVAPGEERVRFALLPAKSLMVPELRTRELVAT